MLLKPLSQSFDARSFVLQLAAFASAHYRDAARQVLDPHGAVGGVHALAARAGGSKRLHLALGEERVIVGGDVVTGVHAPMIPAALLWHTHCMTEHTRYGFPLDAWEAAKTQANSLLVRVARDQGTVTYSEICREVDAIELKPFSWAIMGFLNEICTEADAAHGIMLASLVVRGDTGMPGAGYFRNAARLGRDVSDPEAYWRSEVERIYCVFSAEG